MFINSCGGDVDKALAKLVRFFEMKRQAPELFSNRDIKGKEAQHALDIISYVGLPISPDNCNILLHKIQNPDPKEYFFDDAVKVFIMKSEAYAYKYGPRDGTYFIHDFENACFGHVLRTSLTTIRKGLKFLQEASPLDVKQIHIINTPSFVGYFMAIVKPLLRLDTLNRIHFHSSNMDWEKFYKDFIPKSHLPSNYGGDLASIEELHDKQRGALMELADYFKIEEWQKNGELDQFYDKFMEARAEEQKRDLLRVDSVI
jgi:CRAL/TRIO domain